MQIDKAKFLFFAGSIATGACVLKIDDKKPGTSGAGGSTSATTAASASGSSSTESSGSGCNDALGAPGSCAAITSSCGEGIGLKVCNSTKASLKPKLAEAAVTCMLATPCASSSSLYLSCATESLHTACPDATADATCAGWVSMCGSMGATAAACHLSIDGLTPAARQSVVPNCSCALGLDGCVQLFLQQ